MTLEEIIRYMLQRHNWDYSMNVFENKDDHSEIKEVISNTFHNYSDIYQLQCIEIDEASAKGLTWFKIEGLKGWFTLELVNDYDVTMYVIYYNGWK